MKEKEHYARYEGKTSLFNTEMIGEIWIPGKELRAPCATTLWKYDRVKGRLRSRDYKPRREEFDGTIHIDGYYVKCGWRKYLEDRIGRELTRREWKRVRNRVIWAVATEDKTVLDFEITERAQLHPAHTSVLKGKEWAW